MAPKNIKINLPTHCPSLFSFFLKKKCGKQEKEEQTELLLFPFCYMEANSFYEQKFSPQQALEEMHQYYKVVNSVNGHFIMIWHNSFLGTDKLSAGWREIYEQFIKEVMLTNP